MSKASTRYAKALLEILAAERDASANMSVFRSLAELPESLTARLADATIPVEARSKALLVSIGSPSKDSLLGRLVSLLASRRRLGEIAEISRELLSMMEARAGIVRGTVLAPRPLAPLQIQSLEKSLSSVGSRVELVQETDLSLLGGFRVRLGSQVLDASVANQLNQARRALLSA
ncbi:MAG: ATP synthase F1 subunit delta [Fibrobacteres bacterium]|jgi:F-type H+-transporting ATPase subunit delta|nr:ATP synthase F1 subunit delta [Fibrobacterota bacterium]